MSASPVISQKDRILGGLWGSLVGDAFGNIICVNQPVTDEQRIAFHGFRVFENNVF